MFFRRSKTKKNYALTDLSHARTLRKKKIANKFATVKITNTRITP